MVGPFDRSESPPLMGLRPEKNAPLQRLFYLSGFPPPSKCPLSFSDDGFFLFQEVVLFFF